MDYTLKFRFLGPDLTAMLYDGAGDQLQFFEESTVAETVRAVVYSKHGATNPGNRLILDFTTMGSQLSSNNESKA